MCLAHPLPACAPPCQQALECARDRAHLAHCAHHAPCAWRGELGCLCGPRQRALPRHLSWPPSMARFCGASGGWAVRRAPATPRSTSPRPTRPTASRTSTSTTSRTCRSHATCGRRRCRPCPLRGMTASMALSCATCSSACATTRSTARRWCASGAARLAWAAEMAIVRRHTACFLPFTHPGRSHPTLAHAPSAGHQLNMPHYRRLRDVAA